MDFDLTDEQRLLKDSIDRLIADRYGDFDLRKGYAREPGGWSRAVWGAFAEAGFTALPFDEAMGGIGGGPLETMIVMEAIGRGLALEPYLSGVVLAGAALKHSRNQALIDETVPLIAEGKTIVALAQTERQSRYNLNDVATRARRANGHYVIDGAKSVVLHGDSADKLLVSTRTAGGQRDRDGITLFLIDAKSAGVEIHGSASQDGRRIAEITFSGVTAEPGTLVGSPDHGLPVLEAVVDTGIAALCAEAVGAMEALNTLTVDYLKTRKQFGVPIGSFQALQHRAVDMTIALEQARSMAIFAAMMVDAEPADRAPAISAAKVQINRSARFLGQQAIQLHGGIGVTQEYQAAHYFKRLTGIESIFGDTDYHLAAIGGGEGLLKSIE